VKHWEENNELLQQWVDGLEADTEHMTSKVRMAHAS
jgi:hypothetical protein